MNLPASLTSKVARQVLTFKKQSPHIFFTAGLVSSVAGTVLACRATLKLNDTLGSIQSDLDELHHIHDVHLGKGALSETEIVEVSREYKKNVAHVYFKGGVEIAKLYGPSVILGVVGVTLLTGSHVQLARRNAALTAAFSALNTAFAEYRERVRNELGEEREGELYRGIETVEIDGEEVKVLVDPNKRSPYACFFDEYSPNYQKDPELNLLFLKCQQEWANQKLRARGHLFLNEVYDSLFGEGERRTKAGAVVGWVISKEGPNFVDFGLYNAENSRFVNGFEPSVLLDFNVDGVIYDKI